MTKTSQYEIHTGKTVPDAYLHMALADWRQACHALAGLGYPVVGMVLGEQSVRVETFTTAGQDRDATLERAWSILHEARHSSGEGG